MDGTLQKGKNGTLSQSTPRCPTLPRDKKNKYFDLIFRTINNLTFFFSFTVLTLPPHCSHKLQPLAVFVFGPFKTYFSAAVNSALLEKPGVPITIYDIARLVNSANERAVTPSNIISGFKKTGIFPFDKNIF